MWIRRSKPESVSTGRYWNSHVSSGDAQTCESVSESIDSSLVRTIYRLEQLDDAKPASAAFSRQFETLFLESVSMYRPRQSPRFPSLPAGLVTTTKRDSLGSQSVFPADRSSWRSRLAPVAAAFMLVVLLGGTYVFIESRQQDNPADYPNVILAPSGGGFDVPMDRGNPARSGVMPGPGLSGDLQLRWSFEAGRGLISSPAVVNDTIFITSGSDLDAGSVIAIDAVTGSERWRAPVENSIGASPAIADGVVYSVDVGGIVYAFDARTGEELWRRDLQSGWASPPVVVDGSVYVATAPYLAPLHIAVHAGTVVLGSGLVGQAAGGLAVYALNQTTGEERWRYAEVLPIQTGVLAFDGESGALKWDFEMQSLESGPAVSGNRVYAGSTVEAKLYAIDLAEGNELWQAAIDKDLAQNASPAFAGGNLFITTAFGTVICLDEDSGIERWRAPTQHMSLSNSAIVIDHTVYVVDTAFGVSALSRDDGSVIWTEQLALTGQVIDSPVVSNGNLLVVTSLEGVSSYTATLWVLSSGRSPPVTVDSS